MKGTIALTKTNGRGILDIRNRCLAFKSNAPFINCISKINNVLIDSAEDLDVIMPMYNLFEESKNYRKTTGRLRNYYRDESFKCKGSITGKISNANQENC